MHDYKEIFKPSRAREYCCGIKEENCAEQVTIARYVAEMYIFDSNRHKIAASFVGVHGTRPYYTDCICICHAYYGISLAPKMMELKYNLRCIPSYYSIGHFALTL